jgi:uncharacterized protein (UPF0335 family)
VRRQPPRTRRLRRGIVDDRLKRLVEELVVAINNSISASEQISDLIAELKISGYDVLLLLNAKIAITKRDGDLVTLRASRSRKVEFGFNLEDVQFLKSMHISVNS